MKNSLRIIVPPMLALAAFAACCLAAPAPQLREPKVHVTLKGHLYGTAGLAFSPDGKTLASSGDSDRDLTVRLWDVATGENILTLKGHGATALPAQPSSIREVAFSPDGKIVASCSCDRTVKLWDATTGKNLATLLHQYPVAHLAFHPDGKTLAAVATGVHVWDLEKKEIRASYKIKGPPVAPLVAYDPKGKLLVAGTNNYPEESFFSLWDVERGKRSINFKGHTKAVSSFAFSRDGKTAASAGRDHTVRLWDVATGKNTATFKDHPGRTCALAFSPDGKVLAAGYKHQQADGESDAYPQRGSVRLYETATGKVLATLAGTPGPIAPLAFSPDGRLLATGNFDSKITIWKLPARYRANK